MTGTQTLKQYVEGRLIWAQSFRILEPIRVISTWWQEPVAGLGLDGLEDRQTDRQQG